MDDNDQKHSAEAGMMRWQLAKNTETEREEQPYRFSAALTMAQQAKTARKYV